VKDQEIDHEKEQKRQLEMKIASMGSQILAGGKEIQDHPQFRQVLEEKHRMIRQEYDAKLQEIEKERVGLEENKQQVDRYKQLLLK